MKRSSYLAALAVILSTISTSDAQQFQYSAGLFCNTAEQVQRILTASDHEAERQAVNAEAGTAACVQGFIAWEPIGVVATFDSAEGVTEVMEVTLYGISYDGQTMVPVQPTTQYLPFLANAKPAGLQI